MIRHQVQKVFLCIVKKRVLIKLMEIFFRALARMPGLTRRFLSASLYVLFRYIIPYRREVVRSNIYGAYPKKSLDECKQLEQKFYKYLSHLLPEALAVHEMRSEEIASRVEIQGIEILDAYVSQGKNIILVAGHLCNWELCGQSLVLRYPRAVKTLYMPLKNEAAEIYFKRQRERFGLVTINAKEAHTVLSEVFANEKGQMIAFVADQSPKPQRAYWMRFLGRETGFYKGFELYAHTYQVPVVYIHLAQKEDLSYLMRFELLIDNCSDLSAGKATLLFAHKLEEQIIKQPHVWLWSHKRWKHNRPVNEPIIQ